jgi:precorrin-6A synthase
MAGEERVGPRATWRSQVKKLVIIGIGTGNPDDVTVHAVKALNRVDAFFLVDKGADKDALLQLRKEICERHIIERSYRFVEMPDPARDRTPVQYEAAVEDWHARREEHYARFVDDELRDGECGAFLVWGDPALYDSTLRIVARLSMHATTAFEYEVIPGISSVQLLAARHRIPLNQIGGSVHITTGRRLRAGLPDDIGDVVVMLDGECSFTTVEHPADVEIYWGAYLGTDDEILVSGNLGEIMGDLLQVRSDARTRHGWIMDTYLLRRTDPAATRSRS